MKNSKLRRALLLFACAVLLVCLSVGATLAYLTAQTEMVQNTFTVGKVTFDDPDDDDDVDNGLDEADTDEYGDYVTDVNNRVNDNEYKLIPDHTYIKDPTVHMADGSEPCFLFIDINKTTISYIGDAEDQNVGEEVFIEADADDEYTKIVDQMKANGWVNLTGDIWYYKYIVDTYNDATAEDFVIFRNFKVAADAVLPNSDDELLSAKIEIKAYAVQADGFQDTILSTPDADGKYAPTEVVHADAAEAWAATFGKTATAQ